MLSSFNKILSHTPLGLKGSNGTNFVERDELSKYPSTKKVKKVHFLASREPLLCSEEEKDEEKMKKRSYGSSVGEEKGVIRVKVKMTKQEAARLLSKCKDGGILEFRDAAQELVNIPVNRVSVMSSTGGFDRCRGALQTVPEEN